MILKVTKVDERPSRFGSCFFYIFFKNLESGKSYKTCVGPDYRNFGHWQPVIKAFENNRDSDIIVRNTRVKKGNLLDADFVPKWSVKERLFDE